MGFKSFDEVDNICVAEYELLMKAVRLKQVDLDYRCHLVAYLTKAASAEKPSGKKKTKPVYGTFKKFYDYAKSIKLAMDGAEDQSERFARIKEFRSSEEE